jgi:TPR repeat protein
MKWFRKSADQGDPWAQQHLSEMYEEGLGVPRDPAEARKWSDKTYATMLSEKH